MAAMSVFRNINRLLFNLGNVNMCSTRSNSRRALMYVPGNDLRKLKKAETLKVDCVAFDCEDGVAINKKTEARETIQKVLEKDPLYEGGPERCVRINSMSSGLGAQDIEALLSAKNLPSSILLPKIETPDDLQAFSEIVWRSLMKRDEGDRGPINLILLIESAKSLMTLPELCKSAEEISTMAPIKPVALIFGSDDYLADIGGSRSKTAIELLYARQRLVMIAKAFRLQAIDMVHIDYQDLKSLQREAEDGARMGFTGKQVINPGQVPITQDAFSPSRAQIDWAKGLVAAFNENQEQGQGAFVYRGSMIDMPLLRQAQNILQLANKP